MNCPKCKKEMQWQEGLLRDGGRDMTKGKWYCMECRLFGRSEDSREIKNGKELAKSLVGVPAMDKRITKHSTATQIGILRAKQHCAKCGKPSYPIEKPKDDCQCKTCGCVFCQERKKRVRK